ncbi:MAG: hypothetical protein HRT47_01775 [Candidatus Caenarcaniphilales bacterium]|nr:hypothetical protein [Candidatus Caenarcaniphilales bacterium]
MIVSPDEGYLEWVGGVGIKDHSFKIIHHKHECQRKEKDLPNGFIKDGSLSRYLGVENLQNLYTLLHPGPLYGKGKGILVEDINEYMEILRRLTIPYYEEARIYWPLAEEDGFFCDVNEVYPCLVSTLKLIIEKYK